MNVEYTGRHYEITSAIRKEVENGLAKIRKILGDRFEAKAILAVEKHRHKAEITITPRNGPIVGLAQARDMTIAVNEALDHLEKQAVKYKTRWQSKKRSARKSEEVKKWNGHSPQPEETDASATGAHQGWLDGKNGRPRRRASLPRCGQNHRGAPGSLQRIRLHAPPHARRGHQGSSLPRPRRLRFPRSQRQSHGPAPHPRRQNGVDRSAVKAGFRLRLSGFSKTQCRDDCVHPHLHESVNRFTDCAPGQGRRNCV